MSQQPLRVTASPLEKAPTLANPVARLALRTQKNLNLPETLVTTAQELRGWLAVDRVLIYTCQPKITAEAIAPGITSLQTCPDAIALGQHWQTPPTLEPLTVICDIQTETLPAPYHQALSQLQVQAQIVVPVILAGNGPGDGPDSIFASPRLWGYLVIQHQSPRNWQPSELESLQQLTVQLAIAIHQAALLQQLNQQQLNQQSPPAPNLDPTAQWLISALEHKQQNLDQLRKRFTSIVSHEFRTPLTTIRSAHDLLANFPCHEAEKQALLGQIDQAVSLMTSLLDDLLVFKQVDAAFLPCLPEALEVCSFCQTLISQLGTACGGSHRLALRSSQESCILWVDPKLLQQILSALLINACQYSPPEHSVRLLLRRSGDHLLLQVRDRGIGIPPEEQTQIFEPFYRASNVGTIQGAGLGLTIAQRCAAAHEGTIFCKSILNRGSIFSVLLPWRPLESC